MTLKSIIPLAFFNLLIAANAKAGPELVSGRSLLSIREDPLENHHSIAFTHDGKVMGTYAPGMPLSLEVNGERMDGHYSKISQEDAALVCQGIISTKNGTKFLFTDRFSNERPGSFALRRNIVVRDAKAEDQYFNSLFGIAVAEKSPIEDWDLFVPAVWYRTNFEVKMAGALAKERTDQYFLFREDRLPLPLVMLRSKSSGKTVSLIHAGSDPTTFAGEAGLGRIVDERMQFGSIGVRQLEGTSLAFMFPGSEGERNHVVRRSSRG